MPKGQTAKGWTARHRDQTTTATMVSLNDTKAWRALKPDLTGLAPAQNEKSKTERVFIARKEQRSHGVRPQSPRDVVPTLPGDAVDHRRAMREASDIISANLNDFNRLSVVKMLPKRTIVLDSNKEPHVIVTQEASAAHVRGAFRAARKRGGAAPRGLWTSCK